MFQYSYKLTFISLKFSYIIILYENKRLVTYYNNIAEMKNDDNEVTTYSIIYNLK